MTKDAFFELLGDIDEKYILEANEEDPAETGKSAVVTPVSGKRKNERRQIFLSVTAAAAAILLLIGGLWYAEVYRKKNNNHKLRGLTEHNTAVLEMTTAAGGDLTWATTRPETMAPTEAGMTTTAGEETINESLIVTVEDTTAATYTYVIPAIPSGLSIVPYGDPITDEEAAAYLSEHFNMIKSNLASSEVPTDDLHISEKGYCHVAYDESNSDPLTLNLSHRTYTVYNKNVLVAFITLSRLPGTNEIVHSWGYGGPWFGDYDVFLQTHKGEELLFLYVNGYFEIVIAPDGTLRNPQGEDPDNWNYIFQNIENPYEYLYSKEATYTP